MCKAAALQAHQTMGLALGYSGFGYLNQRPFGDRPTSFMVRDRAQNVNQSKHHSITSL